MGDPGNAWRLSHASHPAGGPPDRPTTGDDRPTGGPDGAPMTAELLIGPLLRRVDGTRATIGVETSEPTRVRVEADGGGAGSAPTFTAYGHHYAVVVVEGLRAGAASAYRVRLDDRVAWPVADSAYPAPVIRTRDADDRDAPVSM